MMKESNIKKINFYLICVICFLLPSYLIRFSIFGVPTTALEILIYLTAIFTFVLNLKKLKIKYRNLNIKNNKILIPIILFLIAGIIGVFISPDKNIALGQFKAFIFDPILFFWILSVNIKSKKQLALLLYAFIYSGIYVSAYSCWQYFTNQFTQDGRIIGLFGYSANYTAFYMVPLTILAIFFFYKDKYKNIFANTIKLLIILLFILSIYLTGSRGAFIALVGSIVFAYFIKFLFYVKIKKSAKYVLTTFVILIILLIGWQFIKPDFSLSSEKNGRITSSNNIRWEIYKTTVMDIIIKNNNWCFGIGLGNYQTYFTELTKNRINYPEWIAPKALTAHNIFLHTWINIGIVGLISFVYLLFYFFKNIKIKYIICFASFTAMIAILIQGIVDTPYWKNDLSIIFWLLIFIGYFYAFNERDKKV